jgi:hypothetical protein
MAKSGELGTLLLKYGLGFLRLWGSVLRSPCGMWAW